MNLHAGWLATTVLTAVLSFSTPLAKAEVYRWVDANGRVHFGDRAPADRKAEALGMPESTGGVATQDVSEQELRERQERVSRVLEEERLEKEQQKAALKQQEAEKAVYCERFRNRMERLEASSQVYSENKDGTVKYWKDKDADRYKAKQRAQYQAECGEG